MTGVCEYASANPEKYKRGKIGPLISKKGRISVIRFKCKNCGQKIRVPDLHAGRKGKCPKCKNLLLVPEINDNIYLKPPDADTDNLPHLQQPPEPELCLKTNAPAGTRFDQLPALGLGVTDGSLLQSETEEESPDTGNETVTCFLGIFCISIQFLAQE